MRAVLIIVAVSICFFANTQNTYSDLTQKAIDIIQNEDSIQYEYALDLFEQAFENTPDSVNGTSMYYASIVASRLNLNDKAFYYLEPLVKMEKDDYGFPGWRTILNDYAKEDYKNLLDDESWKVLEQQARNDSLVYIAKLREEEKAFYQVLDVDFKKFKSSRKLYKAIKKHNPYLSKKKRDYSISLAVNDSLETSFHIHLPKKYDPNKRYSVLFFLHGAVRYTQLEEYQFPQANLGGWNRYYSDFADANEVILVFPSGDKTYNWMLENKGFFMIPKIVKLIKSTINIDDNKIFISGHSNGATGSFSYLMKQATLFAGFYGFNTYPKVFTGGTFIENIKNRSFISFSTDRDYYYPPNANDSLSALMNQLNADYKEYRYNGFPHWFPAFDASKPAVELLFKDLMNRNRNPFPAKITWEFDDNEYGSIDWISNIKLDTLNERADWHKDLNFKINQWLYYDEQDSLVSKTVDKNAFNFPRKSGKIIAEYDNNVFRINTSGVQSFTINISPEMVNLKRKVKVYINNKLYYNKKVKRNRDFILRSFEATLDRKQVWVNGIELKI